MNNKLLILAKRLRRKPSGVLCAIIILLVIFIIVQLMNPKIVEVPKEVIVEKEVVVEVEKEVIIEIEPTYIYNVTSEEREMLARLVYREANIESIECQMAVVSVVINRWENGYWGETIKDVIYAQCQFQPASLLDQTTPNNTNYAAVDHVLKNGVTMPYYVLYFRADRHFSWDGYHAYTQIDKTYFGYMEKDK
jgi:hypothetical protein